MIISKYGNILDSKTEAVINTINTVGVMGKGIAKLFAVKYPDMLSLYKKLCREKKINTGCMFVYKLDTINPQFIINFPTKQHWKNDSKIEYIVEGLKSLVMEVKQRNIKSISIPPLGCGNGNLNWVEVKPLIIQAFEDLPNVLVEIYDPI